MGKDKTAARLDRIERVLIEHFRIDLEQYDNDVEAALEAFAERDPDHAERTDHHELPNVSDKEAKAMKLKADKNAVNA